MITTLNILKIIMRYHFWKKHSITVGNGQQIYAHKMIALPLKIQDHYFEFLVLIVDILDEYDFIIGLEAANSARSCIPYDISYCQYSTQVSSFIFE